MREHGSPRVWIVDDSPLDATMQAESLRGLDVQTFPDASAFLERAMFDTPDVAVLDIVLPDMSGLDVCRYLRAAFDQTQLPVLMVSARTDEGSVLEAFQAGANDHVGKPFAGGLLRARVDALVKIGALRRELDHVVRTREASLRRTAAKASDLEERIRLEELLIGIVGHDLRNPLTAMKLGVHALRARLSDEGALDALAGLEVSLARASAIVRDALDVTELRFAGRFEVRRRAVPLEPWLRTTIASIERGLRGCRIDVRVDIDGGAEGTAHIDDERVAQALANLVTNGTRHATRGTAVTVRAQLREHELVLAVHNVGAAIPDPIRSLLFEPFARGDALPDQERRVGLGLFIVDHVARAHGGDVQVSSTADEGTTFRLALPF